MSSEQVKALRPPGIPDRYEDLVQLLPPRPIHNEMELSKAHEMIDRLVGFTLNAEQEDYLEALTVFVEAYEAEHWPIDTSHITPLESLKFLLEQNDMSASDLGRLLGNRSLGSAILTGRRALSKAHVLKLAERFKVDPGLFLASDAPPKRRKPVAASSGRGAGSPRAVRRLRGGRAEVKASTK